MSSYFTGKIVLKPLTPTKYPPGIQIFLLKESLTRIVYCHLYDNIQF